MARQPALVHPLAAIGNMWKAEALFAAETSPWRRLSDLDDAELRRVPGEAARLMQAGRRRHRIYRQAGRPCGRCGTRIRSFPQGDDSRTAYPCPGCQGGTSPAGA